MIEIFLIFSALIVAPLCVSFPFYVYTSYKDSKDREAQRIIDRLRGIDRRLTDWPGPG